MDKCIDSLGQAEIFSMLDDNSGYWQMQVDETDMVKTLVVTHSGLYKYRRMPLRLKNVPAPFRKAVDVLPAPVKWQHASEYVDDIVIFRPTPG